MTQEQIIDHKHQQLVESVLARHLPEQHWEIARPSRGRQRDVFMVHGREHELFVKFAGEIAAWERLAEISATPPILGSGHHAGKPYIIQAVWAGQHPTRQWFARNISTIAKFIRNYHEDTRLFEILGGDSTLSCAEHLHGEVSSLQELVELVAATHHTTAQFQQSFAQFKQQAASLTPFRFVPIHADPNSANILVDGERMTMIDWGDIKLSDPMRDIAPILWWYLPQHHWLECCRINRVEMEVDKIYWWVARQSLEIALYFDILDEPEVARAFLADFYRAVNQQENPLVAKIGR